MAAKYDLIGTGYNTTRKADPYLADKFLQHLDPKPHSQLLDIGCGTGNYTNTLRNKGLDMIGIDPSEHMLSVAKENNPEGIWKLGTAENTGLADHSVDGIIGCLTIHHWPSLTSAFQELKRVLKPHGKLVLFTSTPEQMSGYWLTAYFPQMVQDAIAQMPSLNEVQNALTKSGFATHTTEKYFVSPDLEDLFLYSGKHQPHLYLDSQVRQGISSFSDLSNAKEVKPGLEQLSLNITSGQILDVINKHENDLGDYLFVIAQKK